MQRARTLLSLLCLAAAAGAAVVLPAVLGDGMVLQREAQAPVWGWAAAGEKVTVSPSWEGAAAVETIAGEDGRWRCELATPAAGGPHTILVFGADGRERAIKDILVGEVWLCSGQSNMEWPVEASDRAAEEIAAASFPQIRLFTVPNTVSAARRYDCEAAWAACTPETVRGFSATGYFCGRVLHQELGVPVGLISADWGGTRIEPWMSAEALRAFPRFADILDHLEVVQDPAKRPLLAANDDDAGWWERLHKGAPESVKWLEPATDASGWKAASLPASFAGELASFDGVVYYRREVEVPAGWVGQEATLELGAIDDFDDAWVGGTRVGGIHEDGHWGTPRRYAVPTGLLVAGSNTIAVRVLDMAGPGGFGGTAEQMLLRRGDETVALAGEWRYAVGPAAASLPPRGGGSGERKIDQGTPSALFRGMISPIVPFAMRGFLWYQGESNRDNAAAYRELLPAMIADWRAQWGRGELPFYFVQIAPFRYGGDRGQTAALREAQLLTATTVAGTAMVVTADIGNPDDIHPTNKQEVGRRLALCALAGAYGRADIVCSGPTFTERELEGGALRVRLASAGGGLVLRESAESHFWVAGADQKFVAAQAVIDGNTVVVSSPEVPRPLELRYGWSAAGEPNLFGGTGLPASPFRSDDWDIALAPDSSDAAAAQWRTREEGFVALSGGSDLSGWVNVNCAPSTWTATDGMIVCSGLPTGVLRSAKQYRNFILELEWRHLKPGGNAGVFVWSDPVTARGQPYTRGIEVQVLDGQEGSWFTSHGDVFPIHGATMTPENGRGGDRAFPTENRSRPSPEWNHYRIECTDGAVALAVNGKVVTRGRDCSPRQGYLCLESEGSPVHFRNIRIKELPAAGELPPEQVADLAQGFVPLYTGVDFAGWKHGDQHQGHWKVADWRIDFDGEGADLWTEKSYKDFVLIADWRWSATPTDMQRPVILPSGDMETDADGNPKQVTVADAGDSGIYLRGSSKSQVNIWCWPCGSGEVYGYRTDATLPAEVRAGVTPKVNADAPLGQWNRFIITMKGDRLTVVLNGQTVLDDTHLPGVAAAGPIALQHHGGKLQFANLYLRELE